MPGKAKAKNSISPASEAPNEGNSPLLKRAVATSAIASTKTGDSWPSAGKAHTIYASCSDKKFFIDDLSRPCTKEELWLPASMDAHPCSKWHP
eukprot:6858612-Karenia_brevis.AAC.1